MFTLFLFLCGTGCPQILALVVCLAAATLAVRQWGARQGIAACALADGVLVPLWTIISVFSTLRTEGKSAPHALHISFEEMVPFFALRIVVYALSVGGLLGLLRRKSVPEGLLPARGIWAKRLVALLSLFGLLFVTTGDMWPALLYGSSLDRFMALLFTLAVVTYLVPLGDVLVRGWHTVTPAGAAGVVPLSLR